MAIAMTHRLLTGEQAFGPGQHVVPPFGLQDTFPGGPGDNTISGTTGADTFNMQDGGDDTVVGRGGNDIFNFGAELTAADAIDGGADADTVNLVGDYAGANALAFGSATIVHVEMLHLAGGNFNLTTANTTVDPNHTLTVDATALSGLRTLVFNGAAETNGRFTILADRAATFLTGGARADTFSFGAHFAASNRIDGRAGDDTLVLDGDYSSGLVFAPNTLHNVETIRVIAGHSYFLTLDNANVLLGKFLSVEGTLGAADKLTVDGSAETSSKLTLGGGAGNDRLVGGGAGDFIQPGAGRDTVDGGAGDDQIFMAGNLTQNDSIDGGAGYDAVLLSGDYSGGLVFGNSTLRNVEALALSAGWTYDLILSSAVLRFGETLTVDARALILGDAVSVNALSIGDGHLVFLGGVENDFVTIGPGGQDVIRTGDGDDGIAVFGNLTETTRIDGGGGGTDYIAMDGDYSDRLEFTSRTVRNIEVIALESGHTYNLVTSDGTVAAGQALIVDGGNLTSGDRLIFDGSAESNGAFTIEGGAGDDRITVAAGDDFVFTGAGVNFVDCSRGGNDNVVGGSGNDTFDFGATFDGLDAITPGAGSDTLLLDGDYYVGFATVTLPQVETVKLAAAHSYALSAPSAPAGGMTIHADHLGPGDTLHFFGYDSESYTVFCGGGDDFVLGSDGEDHLSGNAGNDTLVGSGGRDFLDGGGLDGGGGEDIFYYSNVAHSTSSGFDTCVIDFSEDRFFLSGLATISGIDSTVTTGTLSDDTPANFDGNLTAALSGHLLADHAILFTPDAGSLDDRLFLIIDCNSTAGYQTGADIVCDVTYALNLSDIDTGDFM